MFYLHWVFSKENNGHPQEVRSKICPCVSYGIWCCNLWAIIHPGEVLQCNGKDPRSVCPLANSDDVVVSHQKASELIVTR